MTRLPAFLGRLFAIFAVAVLGALVVLWSYRRPGPVRDLVVRFLGPPERQLAEAYSGGTGGSSVDHSLWDELLREHVLEGGWVDYESFRRDGERLERYLEILERAPYGDLSRDEKLALLLNAYNAFTIRLVTEHLPLGSIKDIPRRERWEIRRFVIGGRAISLEELEHDEIRPRFKEPRIHFALVCAAVGCPPLAREAYVAERLDSQLERQARYVFQHESWFRFEKSSGLLYLSDLFSWFEGDFEQVAGSVLAYAALYAPDLRDALEAGEPPGVRFLPYDWRLNSAGHRSAR